MKDTPDSLADLTRDVGGLAEELQTHMDEMNYAGTPEEIARAIAALNALVQSIEMVKKRLSG